jgi:low affinity Fe/Cu permease
MKLLGAIVLLLGIFMGIGSNEIFGFSAVWGILVFILSIMIMLTLRKLIVVKKDLVIRNKATNAISYVVYHDWNAIRRNTSGNQNSFEIIEELKQATAI